MAKPDYEMSDSVDEPTKSKASVAASATTLATLGGGSIVSLVIFFSTLLTNTRADLVKVETVQESQASQIQSIVARADRNDATLTSLVAKSEKMLGILEQIQRQQDRGSK